MFAILISAILQTSPLGDHPKVWRDKHLGIQLSYPQRWKIEKMNDEKDEPSKTVLHLEADESDLGKLGIEINVHKRPDDWLVQAMANWPVSILSSDNTVQEDLPQIKSFYVPTKIGNIRGYSNVTMYTRSGLNIGTHCDATFSFITPRGDAVQFLAFTTTYGAIPKGAKASPDFLAALPTFNAIVHSITFKGAQD